MHIQVQPAHLSRPVQAAWCPDDDTRDSIIARRNVLFALWAGRLMGLAGPALTDYAIEVHLCDFDLPGDADVLGKIGADLRRCGMPLRPADLRMRLAAFHCEALRQTAVTD